MHWDRIWWGRLTLLISIIFVIGWSSKLFFLHQGFKIIFQFKDVLLQWFQCVVDDFIWLFGFGLHFDFQCVFKWMRYLIPSKFDLIIFEEEDAEEVTNGMILQIHFISHTIRLLMILYDFNSVGFCLLATKFSSEVLTHMIILSTFIINCTSSFSKQKLHFRIPWFWFDVFFHILLISQLFFTHFLKPLLRVVAKLR